MATKRIKQFTSWSFSRWRDFKKCPAYSSWKYLEKLSDGGTNAAMERGTQIHKLAEDHTNGKLKRLPKELGLFKEDFTRLRKYKAQAEDSWTFDAAWGECAWNDWNNAWLRVKVDAFYTDPKTMTMYVIDHKTGSLRMQKEEEYRLQLELTTVAAFKRFPEIEQVASQLWYIDEGVIYPEEAEPVGRDQEAKLTKVWEKHAAQMLNATSFPMKPNDECRWCDFRASKGGPCRHG